VRAQTRAEVTDLLGRHGLHPRKALGQHFLVDPNITAKIVATAGVTPGRQVVEVGAGTGTLTAALAAEGARVLAFEIDRSLAPVLGEVLDGVDNVELRWVDVTMVDLAAELGPGEWWMVANLPYNVGTSVVLDVLRRVPRVTRLVVMVQHEVGERLAASPGDRRYGLPSVVVGLHGTVRTAFKVPPQVFVPAPRVGSVVVAIDRRPAPALSEEAIALARAAFGRRRKMLRASLAAVLAEPETVLAAAGIDPTRRAEELAPGDYARLAEACRG
jgi:16S rRNA (adenine1518-N6/adenine1519-N6)-dimethyltransferase